MITHRSGTNDAHGAVSYSDDSWETLEVLTRTETGFTNPRRALKVLYDSVNEQWIFGSTDGVRTLSDANWPGDVTGWTDRAVNALLDDLPLAYGDTFEGLTCFAVVDPSTKILKIAKSTDGVTWTAYSQYDVNGSTSDEYRVIGCKFLTNGDLVVALANCDDVDSKVIQFYHDSILNDTALNILDVARSWSVDSHVGFNQYIQDGGENPAQDYSEYVPGGYIVYTEHLAVINDVIFLVTPDVFTEEVDLGPSSRYRIACRVSALIPDGYEFSVEEYQTAQRSVVVPMTWGQTAIREGNSQMPADGCHVSSNGRGLLVSWGVFFAEGMPATGVAWSRCVF